jgi:hypothetical protein
MSAASPLYINTHSAQSRPTGAYSPASPTISSAYKKSKMSITQTYFLAHKARGKLSHEAARPDHNLRLLVGHANLLDSLMLELADAEREQESWFNQSVRGASPAKSHSTENRHIQWADTVVEEPEADWEADDADSDSSSDSDSDFDEEEDVEMEDAVVALRRVPSHKAVPTLQRQQSMTDYEEVEEDEEEDYAELTLTRSPSRSASPPELEHDSDSSEDESMPPSPPSVVLPTFTEKQKESIATSAYYDSRQEDGKDAFYDEGYYLPPRNPARLVSAISVY